jgi:hypothetical protein
LKYFNGLNMGEGIAGPSTIGLATTQMYTCMGIAMVNRTRRFGGLYHYPANSLGNPNVVGTIQQMANDIAPDEIVLTPAQSMGFGALASKSGSEPDDVEALTKFLGGCGGTLTVAAPGSTAILTWNGSGPVFNQAPDGLDVVDAGVPDTTRQTMSAGKRDLEGNIWYYGGDGETDGVLEQGTKSTKKSAKGRCVIL